MLVNHKSILVKGTQKVNLGQILHHRHHIGSKTLSFEASKVQRTYHTRSSVGEELLLLFLCSIFEPGMGMPSLSILVSYFVQHTHQLFTSNSQPAQLLLHRSQEFVCIFIRHRSAWGRLEDRHLVCTLGSTTAAAASVSRGLRRVEAFEDDWRPGPLNHRLR